MRLLLPALVRRMKALPECPPNATTTMLAHCLLRFDLPHLSRLATLAATFVFTAQAVSPAVAEPDLKGVFPSSCQRGQSIEITLVGSGVEQAMAVHFARVGVSAEHIEKDRFRIRTTAETPLGDCDLWLATPDGLAGPRRFNVTESAVVTEREANDTSDAPQRITLPAVVEARLDKAADLDWFAFDAEVDQQITITCRSRSLDGSVQPVFTLVAPDGRELLHSSSDRHEPQVTVRLPATGTYRLLVHERAYRKDDASFYRLELANGSAAANDAARLIHAKDLLDAPAVAEQEGELPEGRQAVDTPCRIVGRFVERNDVDWYRFTAKKDQVLHIEAFGERLEQLMDLDVSIHSADGKSLATLNDIAAPKGIPTTLSLASLDAAVDWKAPADGEYDLAIRDLYGSSVFGDDRRYELVVQAQQPSLFVFAMSGNNKPGRGAFVKRGGDTELSVTVVRAGGFAGPVTVRAEGDPAGITIEPCVVGAKEVVKPLKMSAASDAPTGFQTLRLVAEAEIGSDKRTVSVRDAAVIRSGVTRRIDATVIYISD